MDNILHIPRIIAPAFLKRLTTPASSGTTDPKRLKDPAVVFIPEKKSTGRTTLIKIFGLNIPSEATVAMLS